MQTLRWWWGLLFCPSLYLCCVFSFARPCIRRLKNTNNCMTDYIWIIPNYWINLLGLKYQCLFLAAAFENVYFMSSPSLTWATQNRYAPILMKRWHPMVKRVKCTWSRRRNKLSTYSLDQNIQSEVILHFFLVWCENKNVIKNIYSCMIFIMHD